jgi:hypothetical protein
MSDIYNNPMIKALHKASTEIRANKTFDQIVEQFEFNRRSKAEAKAKGAELVNKTVTPKPDVTDSKETDSKETAG